MASPRRAPTRRPATRYLSYAPHSGFGDQMWALLNALALAANLSRTLILPPILKHYDSFKGFCPSSVVPAARLRSRAASLARRRPRMESILDVRASFGAVSVAPRCAAPAAADGGARSAQLAAAACTTPSGSLPPCDAARSRARCRPVSYTHLTLPTICSV